MMTREDLERCAGEMMDIERSDPAYTVKSALYAQAAGLFAIAAAILRLSEALCAVKVGDDDAGA